MPVFQYVATKQSGEQVRGLLHGASLESVAQVLASQGLKVSELSVAAHSSDPIEQGRSEPPPTGARNPLESGVVAPLIAPVSLPDLVFFFRQLATMLDAGIGPSQALGVLSGQTRNGALKAIIQETAGHVTAGRPMSVGFERYPEVFNPLILSMVRTGEEGGFLSRQCSMLSDYLQRDHELRLLIKRETAYPKLVLIAAIVIVLAANFILSSLKPGAPLLQTPLTNPATWLCLGPLILGAIAFARIGMKNHAIISAVQSLALRIPGVGGMIHGFSMAKFGRAFAALYHAGMAPPRALELAADACGNESLRARMKPASDALKDGAPMSLAFGQTGAFSPLVLEMTRTGETTGNVDLMLTKMAEYYEQEGAVQARQAAMILGVVVFLGVAAYVAYVVIGFWSGYGAGVMGAGGG